MESILESQKEGVVLPQHMPAFSFTPPKIISCKDLSLGTKAVTMQLHTHGMHHKQVVTGTTPRP